MTPAPTPRPNPMPGSLDETRIRNGKPRGPNGCYQRRILPAVFGEPHYECELVPESVCPHRPHIWAWQALQNLRAAARSDGLPLTYLDVHSAYRSVALQTEIWNYRLAERRANYPDLPEKDLARQQQKWTAKPGRSAHHTGFALDLTLYPLRTAGRRTPTYRWLTKNARTWGFYPYLPEPWHWEYNPPGLVARLRDLRTAIERGEAFTHLLELPEVIPTTEPAT